ncbi:MAG: class I SAM-dependent methyltransferase [Mycobacteriales bacterium]
MTAQPVEVYGHGLRAAAAGLAGALTLRYADGSVTMLEAQRWVGEPERADESLLARVTGPVLDVGCGPGRLVAALAARGACVLGIDIAPEAVAMTHRRGATALRRSVFDRVPGAGRWGTALLIDGNIGIGGDPPRLLRRLRELVANDGRVLLEAEAPDARSHCTRVRVESPGRTSGWFPWASVSIVDVAGLAARSSFSVSDVWMEDARWFAELHAR